MSFLLRDIRALLFFLALLIYGLAGSPTPDDLGYVEIIVGGLLLASLNFSLLKNFFTSQKWFTMKWRTVSYFLILYGFVVPTIVALTKVTDINALIRDLVAFSFIVLPFLMLPFFQGSETRQRAFIYGALAIALLFTLRTIWVNFIQAPSDDFKLLYLANSPLILWASLFCITRGGYQLTRSHGGQSLIIGGTILIVMGLSIASMVVETQRAFMVATAITILVSMVCLFVRVPHKGAMVVAALGAIYLLFPHMFGDLATMALQKTQAVGLNRRLDEWVAVWQVVAKDPITLFFGIGWGNGFSSPAVANIYVTYTHSLLNFMLLKTGIIGLIFTLIYVYVILSEIVKTLMRDGSVALAYFWPFIIPVFFYASYKSFDFGLLLTLILMTTIKHNYYTQRRDKT